MSHVIVAGPGGYAYNETHINEIASAMQRTGAEVTVLGDGVHAITKEQIEQTINTASGQNEPVTLFIMAHGEIKNGNHNLDIGGGNITSRELFEIATHHFSNKPIDVFMTSCHGGAAIPEVNRLPSGSTLVALSPGSEEVLISNVYRIAEHIENGPITASSLATTYLCKALKNRTAPTMAVSGEGVYDYVHKLKNRLGKPFTSDEVRRVHEKLDSVLGADQVNVMLTKLSSARSEGAVDAVDFGPALAVSFAADPEPQALNSYNPQRGSFGRGRSFFLRAYLPGSLEEPQILPEQQSRSGGFYQNVKERFSGKQNNSTETSDHFNLPIPPKTHQQKPHQKKRGRKNENPEL